MKKQNKEYEYKKFIEEYRYIDNASMREDFEIISKNNYKCDCCCDDIRDSYNDGDYYIVDGKPLCRQCYEDRYCKTCPICEEVFGNHEDEQKDFPKEPLFVKDSKDWDAGKGGQSTGDGIYVTKRYPIFISSFVDISIVWENIEKICEIKDLKKEIANNLPMGFEYICEDCFNKIKNNIKK